MPANSSPPQRGTADPGAPADAAPAPDGQVSAASGRSRGSSSLLLVALLFAVTWGVYASAFGHAFVNWDDAQYVTENPLVLGKQYARLLTAVVSHHYHPLTMLSLAWNVATPLSPRPFIVINVALHTLNTLLVFWLVLLLSRRRVMVAACVALLFGVHPMHVESVAWIAERKDVLYGAFYLGGLIAYWEYLERRASGMLALTFLLFVLACLAKEIAATFPAVMLLLDYWHGRSPRERGAWFEKLPFLVVAVLIAAIVMDVQGGGTFHGLLAAPNPGRAGFGVLPGFTPLERVALPAYGFMVYVIKLLIPTGLSAVHPYPSVREAGEARYLLAPLFLLATIAIALWDLRRTRLLAFGLGWYLVTIAPVLQWIPVGGRLMAERYTYLPYVGLCFVLASAVAAVFDRNRALGLALWAVVGAFALVMVVLTVRQVEVWKDSQALWTQAIRVYPRFPSSYVYRGQDRLAAGHIREADRDFRTAFELGLRSADLYEGLGSAAVAAGQLDSAAVLFDRAVRADPTRGRSYFNRAVVALRLGRPQPAVADLDTALARMPAQAVAFLGIRGYAKAQLKDYAGAIADFDRAIAAGTRDPGIRFSRGNCRLALGDRAGAAEDFRETLRMAPRHAGATARLQELGLQP